MKSVKTHVRALRKTIDNLLMQGLITCRRLDYATIPAPSTDEDRETIVIIGTSKVRRLTDHLPSRVFAVCAYS